MDRLIYTAASGAKHILEQQATTSNNLANVSTTGFRAQIDMFRAAPVQGPGMPTRAFVVDSTAGNDFASGPLQATGRDLDVAVKGQGWLAHVLVQQVLEHGARLLKAGGADVGEVVRDDVEIGLLGFQAGLGDVERTDHCILLLVAGECLHGQ